MALVEAVELGSWGVEGVSEETLGEAVGERGAVVAEAWRLHHQVPHSSCAYRSWCLGLAYPCMPACLKWLSLVHLWKQQPVTGRKMCAFVKHSLQSTSDYTTERWMRNMNVTLMTSAHRPLGCSTSMAPLTSSDSKQTAPCCFLRFADCIIAEMP